MPVLSSTSVLRLVDSVAVVLSRAYQLARVRLASAASPVLRIMMQRDHALTETELLRRELAILRGQREGLPPHRRPEYGPEQRLAILQLRQIRGWSIIKTAERFVVHPRTVRSWMRAVERTGRPSLLAGAVVWNRIDDAVRWVVHELHRLCPEPEFGTRTMAWQVLRASIKMSRSTVQRILREPKPARPRKPAMAAAMGKTPYHLLTPKVVNRVWHMDLTTLHVLWFRFTLAAILDGFSRKLLALQVYAHTPRTRDLVRLVGSAVREHGQPRFIITDHGSQFRSRFRVAIKPLGIIPVQARVRAPYLDGKMERAFRTFRLWWRVILTGLTRGNIQRRLDDYRHSYNHYRAHGALHGLTPEEAWCSQTLPEPIAYRARDAREIHMTVQRLKCRSDPRLPIVQIGVRRAA